jgi:hypothetical protein
MLAAAVPVAGAETVNDVGARYILKKRQCNHVSVYM